MEEPQEPQEEDGARDVSARWYMPSDVRTTYASHFAVQIAPNEFVLNFFEVRVPLIIGNPEEVSRQIEEIEYIPFQGVARIVITPSTVPAIIGALQQKLEEYQQRVEEPHDDE